MLGIPHCYTVLGKNPVFFWISTPLPTKSKTFDGVIMCLRNAVDFLI